MHKLLALLLGSIVFASPALAAPAAEPLRDGGPRIRLTDPRLAQLVQNGIMRSATMKTLVDRIEAADVIVYVSLGPLMQSSLAGKLTWMTQAGDFRYLRAQINTELNANQMIATMAHEFQHVLEVIEDEQVTDQRSLVQLYKRIGHQSRSVASSGWETVAAYETGLQVRKELAAMPTVLASVAEHSQM